MKQITQQQIEILIQEFYKLNAPVQNFEAIRKMLQELPEANRPESKKK